MVKTARKRSTIHLHKQKSIKLKFKFSSKTWASLKIGIFFLLFVSLTFIVKSIYISVKNSVWSGDNQLVVVYEQNNNIGMIKFDPILHEAIVISFPPNMLLPLALGYQDYRVDKVKALALQERINLGALLKDSITQSIGILTDAYIIEYKDKNFKLNSLIFNSLINQGTSNLTAWDKVRLWFFVFNLKANEVKHYQADNEFLAQKTIADDSKLMIIDDNVLTNFVLQELANPIFLQEKLTWEIYNATNYDGLANNMRRIVANSGFDVTGIRQALETKTVSTLYISDAQKINDNIKIFARFFHFPIIVDNNYTQRSDVALYLGEDYWERYFTNKGL